MAEVGWGQKPLVESRKELKHQHYWKVHYVLIWKAPRIKTYFEYCWVAWVAQSGKRLTLLFWGRV